VEVKRPKFLAEVQRFTKIGIDSSILIYHLEDVKPYSDLTEAAFEALAEGAPNAVISTLCITELLVKPFADRQPERVALFEQFVLSIPNMTLMAPTYPIARQAAALRAKYQIRTPEALLVATSLNEQAEAFLTNDKNLRKLKAEGLSILLLEDYI